MSRRHTPLRAADSNAIGHAAAILRSGGLVAFPTETVYGLGAHALDARAVRGIFEAKSRPAEDPLIVHVGDMEQLEDVATANARATCLAQRFWPGPLTLILPKQPVVPAEVSAGLSTVGVRIPSHPVARALLEAAQLPVAAPSANLFGRPSPTRAQHVLADLDGRIDLVLDGGPTEVGVESTIVDLSSPRPRLLRPGGVAAEDIEAVLGERLEAFAAGPLVSPGLLPVHYSPRTPLTLVVGPAAAERLVSEVHEAVTNGQQVGVVTLEDDVDRLPAEAHVEVIGAWSDPTRSAARLFDALRSLDAQGLDVLFARELADPSVGLGRALADRLRRASQQILDSRQ